ncbi:hypothetical protein FHS29_002235 [Saccharothrix tamanrassetensis]|uniref:Uncharacterized protein n=1 Tax=Saccharothrix tamanrassetensis TaxID=1051531 RepID=A0A841CH14_9PSEU|nr:hypothetical protein [Saccharothrix tamanrassetensis]MBB5955654.1 hypothetical protein [Saccharothrix tamanrassetensis]
MARWVWPTAAGVVTSATGVAVNLATDQGGNPWTWGGVVVLTAIGVVVGLAAQRSERKRHQQQPEPARAAGVHNSVTGTVHGGVVQAGTLGSVTLHSGPTINQNATAHEGGTIHQAGRDIRHDRGQ